MDLATRTYAYLDDLESGRPLSSEECEAALKHWHQLLEAYTQQCDRKWSCTERYKKILNLFQSTLTHLDPMNDPMF